MKKQTRVTHPKEVKLLDGNASVVPPVYRTVKFTYPTIAASLTAEAKENGFDYTRDSNPTTRELELLAAELQDRDDAIAVGSGMAAIWLALLGNLSRTSRRRRSPPRHPSASLRAAGRSIRSWFGISNSDDRVDVSAARRERNG